MAASSASAGMGGRDQEDAATARLMPHTGWVFLDQTRAGTWVLTHTYTRKQKLLPDPSPDHQYALNFDDDGFAMVCEVSAEGEEVDGSLWFVEDRLQWSVYQEDSGDLWFVRFGESDQEEVVRLADFGRQYRLATITAKFGPSMKESDFECCIFRMPRGGNKLFVSSASLYKSLCLTQFGVQSSRWFYKGRARWSKVCLARCPHRIERMGALAKSGADQPRHIATSAMNRSRSDAHSCVAMVSGLAHIGQLVQATWRRCAFRWVCR